MIEEKATRRELLRIIANQQAMIAAQQEQIAALTAQVAVLRARVQELEAQRATDSHNSSKPPSSDGPGVKPHPKSLRTASGRKPGGQPGHVGTTLRQVAEPDEMHVHAPTRCQACGRSLEDIPALRRERRQVVDLPPVMPQVAEHQAETKRCPGCGAETSGRFPEGVEAPVQYGPGVAAVGVYLNQAQLVPLERTAEVLAEVFGCPLSERTLERAVGACHERLAAVEAAIKRGVAEAKVAHFDETGLRVESRRGWLHVASTAQLTHFSYHAKRGTAATDAIGILPAFRGRAVHDGWQPYFAYACAHALRGAHHLRELTFVEEQLGQPWAKDLKDVLLEIKRAVDEARARGEIELSAEVKREFERRYDAILAAGLQANPPPEPTGQRGRPKRGKAGSLVDRLRGHKGATLAFMDDFAIPFDNNQAERDIRMTKVRQKISGCFRRTTGAERFCRVRGYISTLRKQRMPILSALGKAMIGAPPLPATTWPGSVR
jgi:transposase